MKIAILVLTIFCCLGQFAQSRGQDRGGDDAVKNAEERIRFLLEGVGLKAAMLNYLDTIQINQIDESTANGKLVKQAFQRMNAGNQLRTDIMTLNNYEIKASCLDSGAIEVPASAALGDLGGKICFDIAKLSEQFKNLNAEEVMINLASIAFHEHVHHFQNSSTSITINEAEAYAVTAYVLLTAKIAQLPVLKWNPAGPFVSVCDRSFEIRSQIEMRLRKDCVNIDAQDLLAIKAIGVVSSNAQFKETDLQGLYHLEYAKMHFAPDSSFTLPEGFFNKLKSLKRVEIYNQVGFPEKIFEGLDNLQDLELGTYTGTLPENVFKNLPSLKTIGFINQYQRFSDAPPPHLAGPGTFIFPEKLFSGITNMTRVMFAAPFESIPENLFKDQSSLRQLEMVSYSSKPVALQKSFFSPLNHLNKIALGFYTTPFFSESMIQDLKELKSFKMHAHLSAVPVGIFKGLRNLEEIQLGHNDLMTLPEGLFDGLVSLKSVNLFQNNFAPRERQRIRDFTPKSIAIQF